MVAVFVADYASSLTLKLAHNGMLEFGGWLLRLLLWLLQLLLTCPI
jgi:hypothetical protein